MGKVTLRHLTKDDPIFSGRFVTSSPKSPPRVEVNEGFATRFGRTDRRQEVDRPGALTEDGRGALSNQTGEQ